MTVQVRHSIQQTLSTPTGGPCTTMQSLLWLLLCLSLLPEEAKAQLNLPNIAEGLPAFSSSVNSGRSHPENALDGSEVTDYHEGSEGSCFHSEDVGGVTHWWAVDLGAPADINEINITNREDCCGYRLQNTTVATTDCLPTGGSNWRPESHPLNICGTVVRKPGLWWNATCNHRARIVVIYKTNSTKGVPLQFCEVKVHGQYLELPNLAKKRRAFSSSTICNRIAGARNAVDGSNETRFWSRSCFHSKNWVGVTHWWAVDLGAPAAIVSVNITNRGDCCGYRLQNTTVATTDRLPTGGSNWKPESHSLHVCGTVDKKPGSWWSTTCNHQARMVVIYKTDSIKNVPLQFCEVKVHGQYLIKEWTNLAKNQPAFSSSRHFSGKANPENAVDGSHNANFMERSCFHSEDQGGVTHWWAVDLGAPALVVSVNITNRGDCCGYRLQNTTVAITDRFPIGHSNWKPESHPLHVCGTVDTEPGSRWSTPCNHQGRIVVIYKTNSLKNVPLQFCEVEVYGQLLFKGGDQCGVNNGKLITPP